jgi:hypothetical protein
MTKHSTLILLLLCLLSHHGSAQLILLGHPRQEAEQLLAKRNISEYKSRDGYQMISYDDGAITSLYKFNSRDICINCTFLFRDQDLINYQLTKMRMECKPSKYSPDDSWTSVFEGMPIDIVMVPVGQNKMFSYAYDSIAIYNQRTQHR